MNKSLGPVTNVKLVNNVGAFEFGSGSEFGIMELSGIAKTTNTLNITKNAQYDGGIITSNRMEPRDIVLTCEYLGGGNKYQVRGDLIRFFNPKLPGKLYVTYGETVKDKHGKVVQEPTQRTIDYHLDNFAIGNVNMYEPLKFMATLICPDPFFKALEPQFYDMTKTERLFAAPAKVLSMNYKPGFAIPDKSVTPEYPGVALSLRRFNQEETFYVYGDKEVGLKAVFYAKGDVVNPMIENLTTQKFIRVVTPLEAGEQLEINTRLGEKSVILVRVDGSRERVSHMIDPRSSFFAMQPGENTVRYDTDDGFSNLIMQLEWEDKYLGV